MKNLKLYLSKLKNAFKLSQINGCFQTKLCEKILKELVEEKFTSTNTGNPKLLSEQELIRYIESNASHIDVDHAQSVYRWLVRQLRADA